MLLLEGCCDLALFFALIGNVDEPQRQVAVVMLHAGWMALLPCKGLLFGCVDPRRRETPPRCARVAGFGHTSENLVQEWERHRSKIFFVKRFW